MRVLLTRPLADAERTAERLRQLGHEPVLAPLMEIVGLQAELPPGELQAVALTSANAVRAIADQRALHPLRSLKAFPVGERTAAAAREAGFADLAQPAGNGRALVELIGRSCRPDGGTVVHPGGRELSVDVAALLRERGFEARHLAVYEARPVKAVPADAAEALAAGRIEAGLVYSPRSARLLLDLAAKAGLSAKLRRLPLAVMSEAVAEPLRRAGHSVLVVARENDEGALFEALGRLADGVG